MGRRAEICFSSFSAADILKLKEGSKNESKRVKKEAEKVEVRNKEQNKDFPHIRAF